MHDRRDGGVAQGGGQLGTGRHPLLFAAVTKRVQSPKMCGATPFAPDSLGNLQSLAFT
jgi:hypothetical protein